MSVRRCARHQFPVALETDQQLALQYQVIGLPTTIWIDTAGMIADPMARAMSPDVLQDRGVSFDDLRDLFQRSVAAQQYSE